MWRYKYKVVWTKSVYLGCGNDRQKGDLLQYTFTKAEAKAIINQVYSDPWFDDTKDCLAIEEVGDVDRS